MNDVLLTAVEVPGPDVTGPDVTGAEVTGFEVADLCRVLGRPLSDQQLEVVTAPLTPGVVVAGAGSGKTATMVARVLWLVGRGLVTPDGVLGLTFTSKAADELAGRVRRALEALRAAGGPAADGLEPTISTYHAFAGRLVRDHALRLGREPGARLVTPATSWQLAARAVATYDGPMDALPIAESTAVQWVLGLAGDLCEHLVEPAAVTDLGDLLRQQAQGAVSLRAPARQALSTQAGREQLLPIVDAYRRAKAERDLLDFGDVVALAARLARDCPEVALVERAAFPVVLLDEYQDTGAAQEVLLAALFGAGHAVTAVGDPCQSIYGWRGASAGTLRRFGQRFAGDGPADVRSLSTTYRSGGRLLRLANAVSGPLRAEGVPVAELAAAPGREDQGAVRAALLTDVEAEARWVALQVRDRLVATRPTDPSGHWARAAVLCRKRSMFPRLRQAFEALDVPVEVVGLGGLLDVPEVADLVATLRVLDDPTADADLLRLLAGARWRIGPRDLAALGRRARDLVRSGGARPSDPLEAVVLGVDESQVGSLVDALDDLPATGLSDEGRRRLEALRGELRALRRRVDQPLPELVADVERTLGLDVEVAARPGVTDPAAARADLDAFADAAAAFAGDAAQDGSGEAVLSAFLAFLSAAEDEENGLDTGGVSGTDTVKLMTVHAAKGLEWPVVAVPGLAGSTAGNGSRVFPGQARGTSWLTTARLLPFPLRGDAADLPRLAGLEPDDLTSFKVELAARDAREERRLAYVAFTRAEDLLLCSGYHWGEGATVLGPSAFLLEARQACEQGAGDVDRWDDAPAVNPLVAETRTQAWPAPEAPAAPGVLRAATRVRELLRDGPGEPGPELDPAAARLVAGWDADLTRLQAEQARRRAHRGAARLPEHLSVSALVELQRDPEALAAALLRPMPRAPSPVARRGTAFHAWLEKDVFGLPQLLDPDELPGAADESAAPDGQLADLQERFRSSAWWGRDPVEIEVPFEMALEGIVLRGRMDAVYRDADGDEVVDWKTGRPPTGAAATAAAVQLAAYRLAWSALTGTPLDRVRAAFHYVREDRTVRPADLLDADGLRALVRSVPTG